MRLFIFFHLFLCSTTLLAQEKSGDFADSAFVKLMNTFNGGEIPYPFESLMDSFGTGVKERGNILMVPNGRSLVKNNTDYKNPRIIVNPLDNRSGSTPNDKVEWAERDKLISNLGIKNGDLYIGFAPDHKALEVISFNPRTNKYDFFVIEDYETGKKPKVVSNPPLCLSCHQNGAPIFPTFPWGEMLGKTADNILEPAGVVRHSGKNELMERVKAANPDRDSIEGINIKNPARFDVFKVVDFDVGIRGANTSLMNRNICANLCDTSVNQIQCKKDVFNYYKNTLLDGPGSKNLKDDEVRIGSILKNYKKKIAQFSMKSNFIGVRNPYLTNVLTKDQDPATPRDETEDLKNFKKAIRSNNPEALKKAVEMCFDNPQFVEAAKKISSSDFRKFMDSQSTEDVLKLWPKNRNALSILFSSMTNAPAPDLGCFDQIEKRLEVLQVNNQVEKIVGIAAEKYIGKPKENFQKYCSQCHGGLAPFIPLPLESMKELANYSPKFGNTGVLMRLEQKIMPPEGALQPTAEERKDMIGLIKSSK